MTDVFKKPNRPEYLEEAALLFSDTSELFYRTIDAGVKKEDEDYFILLSSMLNISVAIQKLLYKDVHTENEAYMLMRPLLERLVNYHYLKSAPEIVREKYFSYPFYKIFHNRTQDFKVGDVTVSLHERISEPDTVKEIPQFKKALDLFSDTNNRLNWTSLSFRQRAAIAVKSGNINEGILVLTSMVNYSDTSEVIHGSMYGLMVLTGIWDSGSYPEGKITAEESGKRISEKLTLQLCLFSMLFRDTIAAVDSGKLATAQDELKVLSARITSTLKNFDKATDQ